MSDSIAASNNRPSATLSPKVVARWRALGLDDDASAFERTIVSTQETSQIASALHGLTELLACIEDDAEAGATIETRHTVATAEASPDEASAPLPALDVLGLECGAVLGTGGMAVVRQAHQGTLGREVAVKIARRAEVRASLLREAWASGALEHPNVVPVHHLASTADGRPALVMKRISGTSWRALLADPSHPLLEGLSDRLGFHLGVLMQVCNAVHYAHSRGVLHRDIKPENVMIGDFGEVYLMDWGIAVATDARHRGRLILASQVDGPSGTPCYMAPEMIDPSLAPLGPHSDVFLLGATLHELLTGRAPHQGDTLIDMLREALRGVPPQYGPEVSPELAAVARRAMAFEVDERFESAEAMRRALVEVMRHQASRELGEEAAARLEQLVAAVDGEQLASASTLQQLYSEARFGCEQALRAWPDNQHAARVRRDLLMCMARHELAAGNVAGAERLVAELEAAPQALVDALEARRGAEHDALAELAALRRDTDLRLAARARAAVFMVIVVVILAMFVIVTWHLGLGAEGRGVGARVLPVAAVLAVLASAVAVRRRQLLRTRIDRQFFGAVLALVAGAVVQRGMSTALGATVSVMHAQEFLLLAVGSAMIAATVDRFFAWVCAVFVVGLGVVLALPAWALLISPIVSVAASSVIGVGWLRLGRQSQDDAR